jgi:DHA1 family inner membrane transport protein
LPALLALALGYFAFGTSSLALVGLSPSISGDLSVPAARVGLLVSVFALTFAVSTPVLPVLLGRLDRKHTLLLGLAVMSAGGVLSAVATSYAFLAVARVVTALGAAAYAPQASAAGSLIVPDSRRPRALATVFGGMTAAAVLGVPLATFLGNLQGWRWALTVVAGLTILALGLVAVTLPRVEAGEPPRAAGYRTVLGTPGAAATVLTTLLFMATQFTVYGVAAAYIADRFDASTSQTALVLLAFGVLGVIGNAVGSRVYRALGGPRTITLTLAGLAVAFLCLTATPAWIGAAGVLFAFWAFFSQLYQAPQQNRLIELLPEHRAIALALNASTMYLGVSLGSLLGGTLLTAVGARALTAVALLPLAGAVAAHVVSTRRTSGTHVVAAPVPVPTTTPATARSTS